MAAPLSLTETLLLLAWLVFSELYVLCCRVLGFHKFRRKKNRDG